MATVALAWAPRDPSPGVHRSKAASRQLECTRLSAEEAEQRFPDRVREEKPRGDYFVRKALHCQAQVLAPGVRHPRDEAILKGLDTRVREIASAAKALRPDLAQRTWIVEAYYPDVAVGTKLAFAAKTALMSEGLPVSDRTPALAIGDVQVLTRLPPEAAFPAACERYTKGGSLKETDALLAVLVQDRVQTVLQGAICADGRWTWLR